MARPSPGALALLVVLLAAGSCVKRPVSQSTLQGVSTVAVVVRAGPEAEGRAGRGATVGSEALARMAEAVGERTGVYVLEESIRQAFEDALGSPPPFAVAPSLQVASALGALLAREERPRYDRLTALGVDAVLEVHVVEWGVSAQADGLGGYAVLDARLLRIERGRVLWRGRVRLDRAGDPDAPVFDVAALAGGDRAQVEALVVDLSGAAGRQLADRMGLTAP